MKKSKKSDPYKRIHRKENLKFSYFPKRNKFLEK